ncbi:Conserved_hypothetical protein [Hexamita inflata]|uniref:Uncharacterized protein n=1 Tax=Hexamita inflata TaxID=28002 RepID=A0AA86PK89_9EUKA|nr:Conserved hypothetical protein [Hexamita inflata]
MSKKPINRIQPIQPKPCDDENPLIFRFPMKNNYLDLKYFQGEWETLNQDDNRQIELLQRENDKLAFEKENIKRQIAEAVKICCQLQGNIKKIIQTTQNMK